MVAPDKIRTTTPAGHDPSEAPRPLRVLQVNSLFNGGGADNQTLELCAGLQELGQQVTLAVATGSRWEPLAKRLAGVRVETFLAKGLKGAMIGRLVELVRQLKIQILHTHQGRDYWPGILAARAARRGTHVVVTRHLMTRPRTLSRWLLLRMAHVVAVSKAVEAVLQRELHGPKQRLHQIYGGIDVSRFQPGRLSIGQNLRQQYGWSEDHVVFGVVGAFNLPRGKGQLEFLEAAAHLRDRFPNARFTLVGGGSMDRQLREQITALGLERVASMIPFTDEIAPLIRALDVLVHPAVGSDAFPLVVLEGLASGRPVVASRLDGIPEQFREGEHGLLVKPGDVAELASAMKTLLQSPEQRLRFGQAGREHICRNYSRAELARQVHALYLRLCAPNRG